MNARDISPQKNYWITCVTREEYLMGARVLLKSLRMVNSKYDLIVMVPKTLSVASLDGPNLIILPIEFYSLPASCQTSYVFERFADTWNKLLCWTVDANMLCWLDADMLILKNMDDLFDVLEPSSEQSPLEYKIAACPGILFV